MKTFLEARGEVSVLSGPDGNFEQALAFAKQNNTRLFTRAEAMHLLDTSEAFRASVRDTYFWVLESASVNSVNRSLAWLFGGNYGDVLTSSSHYNTYGIRCVAGE